jgi:pyruvate/2-oxoglutarate dehydrogenase complex dihydrolipoamide acyltransferase (E2) component
MAKGVLMPKAGITVESCIIGEWLKQVGDQVKVGDILFTYETDKAAFECESTAEGELLEIFYEAGDEVPCLLNVCAICVKGEDCSALKGAGGAEAPAEAAAAPAEPEVIKKGKQETEEGAAEGAKPEKAEKKEKK